jgi:probable rRNA maturation factor
MTTERIPQVELEVQYALEDGELPTQRDFRVWTLAALQQCSEPVELVIRVVDAAESRDLNRRYRGKDKATNVLSFPFEAPLGIASRHLGDVVICAPVVKREALEQGKRASDHWAHMVVHGILHLCGFDHHSERDAGEMEALEKRILQDMGIADPYDVAM